MPGAVTTRITALFCVAVAAINGAHPILHAFEGGSLDAVLGYLNATACQLANSVASPLSRSPEGVS